MIDLMEVQIALQRTEAQTCLFFKDGGAHVLFRQGSATGFNREQFIEWVRWWQPENDGERTETQRRKQ